MIRNGLEQRCDELTPYADYRLRKEWISSPLKALLKCPFLHHTAPAVFLSMCFYVLLHGLLFCLLFVRLLIRLCIYLR